MDDVVHPRAQLIIVIVLFDDDNTRIGQRGLQRRVVHGCNAFVRMHDLLHGCAGIGAATEINVRPEARNGCAETRQQLAAVRAGHMTRQLNDFDAGQETGQ